MRRLPSFRTADPTQIIAHAHWSQWQYSTGQWIHQLSRIPKKMTPPKRGITTVYFVIQIFLPIAIIIFPMVVRRQKPIFGLKCAISGNNHLFAFFDSSWYVDKILPGLELAIGLAFSESKMAARMGETYSICRSEHICCSTHTTMTVLVSKCMFLMMRNPMLWLLY